MHRLRRHRLVLLASIVTMLVALAGYARAAPISVPRDVAENTAIIPSAGSDPKAPDPVFLQPVQTCFVAPSSPAYPTVANLLAPAATTGLADSIAAYVALAHADHLPLRVDEINTDSCGAGPGVSNAFVSALWALDTLFEMARVGVDGVNIHAYPGATYQLFTPTHDARGRGGRARVVLINESLDRRTARAGSPAARASPS